MGLLKNSAKKRSPFGKLQYRLPRVNTCCLVEEIRQQRVDIQCMRPRKKMWTIWNGMELLRRT